MDPNESAGPIGAEPPPATPTHTLRFRGAKFRSIRSGPNAQLRIWGWASLGKSRLRLEHWQRPPGGGRWVHASSAAVAGPVAEALAYALQLGKLPECAP